MRTSGQRRLHLGGLHQLVDGGDPERRVDLGVELLAQRRLDARAQLGERVELARGARELVVELGQHLLLHLAHGHLDGRARPVGQRDRDLLRLAGGRADEGGLELRREPPAAELDHGVVLRLPVGVDEVDDERVARLRGPVAGRRELGDRLTERLDLGVHRFLRHLDLGARRPRGSSSRRSRAAPAPRPSR